MRRSRRKNPSTETLLIVGGLGLLFFAMVKKSAASTAPIVPTTVLSSDASLSLGSLYGLGYMGHLNVNRGSYAGRNPPRG